MGKKERRHSAFISYASPDEQLAEAVYDLLKLLDLDPFFAKRSLQRVGGDEWRKQVIDGISSSATFLPIFTRDSVDRPWVLFESGVAEAFKVPRLPVRTSAVDMPDIQSIGKDVTVYDISDETSLFNLLAVIYSRTRKVSYQSALHKIKRFIVPETRERIKLDRVLDLSKDRWIFIAGNKPSFDHIGEIRWIDDESKTQEYRYQQIKEKMSFFSRDLSLALFGAGFRLMSCPQVELVGRQVAFSYLDHINSNNLENSIYRIGGLYPIDRDLRAENESTADYLEGYKEGNLGERLNTEWKDHLIDFRRSYLAEMEWLILLGGSVGTTEEYIASKSLKIKICPIPFFGGAAYEIWKQLPANQRPFPKWTPDKNMKSVGEVVRFLKTAHAN